MPCLRGIEVSITAISGTETCKLPEFPHPDGTSVNIYSSGSSKHSSFLSPRRPPPSPTHSDGDGVPIQKSNPKIAVYVPSVPDANFFFDYAITKIPADQKYLFFKVIINGRRIVSWGIDLRTVTSGTVYKALYEPSEQFQHRDQKGVLKAAGIEARHFQFVASPKKQSVADDGGLIEFQVFRSKGRNPRAILLDSFRSQEKYGIALRSEGLLNKPEETTYYDYLLTDPKDAPYASFHFHYRSWKNLTQLHLVPADDRQISPSTSSSTIRPPNDNPSAGRPRKRAGEQFSFEFPPRDEVASDDGRQGYVIEGEEGTELMEPTTSALESPPALPPTPRKTEQVPQPSKAVRDGFPDSYLRRALPGLPPYAAADESKTHSRHSSSTSKVSITPSLYPYIEDESFLTEDIEIGIARSVEVVLHHDPKKGTHVPREAPSEDEGHVSQSRGCDASTSDYSSSIISSNESKTSPLLSPGNYLASNGSDLYSSSLPQAPDSHSRDRDLKAHQLLGPGLNGINAATHTFTPPTEGEWMNRTWDPIKRTPRTTAGFASPQVANNSSRRVQVSPYRPSSENTFYGGHPRPNGWTELDSLGPSPMRRAQSPARPQRRWNEYPVDNENDGNWI